MTSSASGTADDRDVDVVVIGGGQAALATAYFLRRTSLRFVVLDDGEGPGGAWRHGWSSLRLFSPASWSSLPGWLMPAGEGDTPTRDEVIAYLAAYEQRYALPIVRPCRVRAVDDGDDSDHLVVTTDHGAWRARAVVSATGTWRHPFVPHIEGEDVFGGETLHSARYVGPAPFVGRRVLVVGGGNSGVQIFAELSTVADASWVTTTPPVFLPDDVDGRVLFLRATERLRAQQEGRDPGAPVGGLGDIVMVRAVVAARARGVLQTVRPFTCFTATGVVWADGRAEAIDAVVWCTGFRPALEHLVGLDVIEADGRLVLDGTRSVQVPRLWLVGYGDWTGAASATLIGVTRTARSTVASIEAALTAG